MSDETKTALIFLTLGINLSILITLIFCFLSLFHQISDRKKD